MVVDLARIERLERELEQAKVQLWKEDAERYRVLMREISKEEKDRILGSLTNKGERVLFGLEPPEEPKGTAIGPGSRGDLSCPICGKSGLTKRGLGLHMVRLHKSEIAKAADMEAA
jgi:hypothetical protein